MGKIEKAVALALQDKEEMTGIEKWLVREVKRSQEK